MLWSGLFCSRLRQLVVHRDYGSFWRVGNRVVGALSDRVVRRQRQFADVSAEQNGTFVGREITVGQAEAEEDGGREDDDREPAAMM